MRKKQTYFQDSGISFPYCKEESRTRNYAKYLNVSYVAISMQDCIYLAYPVTYNKYICYNGLNDSISNINSTFGKLY